MKSPNELLSMVLANTTDDMFVLNPCEVVNVNGNYVDVKIYINDEYPNMVLYNVPIQRQETQRAYIFLGIKEGDRGTLKFFDRSVEGYLQSDFDYNSDDRQHSINDRCFELGFIPDKEAYVYPTDREIEIGLKNGNAKISIDPSGNINIYSVDNITVKSGVGITLDSPDVTTTGNLSAGNGKSGMYATQSGVLTFSNGILTAST